MVVFGTADDKGQTLTSYPSNKYTCLQLEATEVLLQALKIVYLLRTYSQTDDRTSVEPVELSTISAHVQNTASYVCKTFLL